MNVKNSGLTASGQTQPKNVDGAYSLEIEKALDRMYSANQNAETLFIDKGFTGRLMVSVENGKIMRDYPIPGDHYTTSILGFIEILEQAGYQITAPVTE